MNGDGIHQGWILVPKAKPKAKSKAKPKAKPKAKAEPRLVFLNDDESQQARGEFAQPCKCQNTSQEQAHQAHQAQALERARERTLEQELEDLDSKFPCPVAAGEESGTYTDEERELVAMLPKIKELEDWVLVYDLDFDSLSDADSDADSDWEIVEADDINVARVQPGVADSLF
jgi:hypothetical protein